MDKTKRYLYVMFMCQQAIEKILKAIITTISDVTPPRTHDLLRLSKHAGFYDSMNKEQIELLLTLTPFCIETRYPDYREKMSKLSTKNFTKLYLLKTNDLHLWLEKKIK